MAAKSYWKKDENPPSPQVPPKTQHKDTCVHTYTHGIELFKYIIELPPCSAVTKHLELLTRGAENIPLKKVQHHQGEKYQRYRRGRLSRRRDSLLPRRRLLRGRKRQNKRLKSAVDGRIEREAQVKMWTGFRRGKVLQLFRTLCMCGLSSAGCDGESL